jgi:hypothetical protein
MLEIKTGKTFEFDLCAVIPDLYKEGKVVNLIIINACKTKYISTI